MMVLYIAFDCHKFIWEEEIEEWIGEEAEDGIMIS